jgi:phosphoribosylglycinamide formyltransferase-1
MAENELFEKMNVHEFDLLVLAGFMKNMSAHIIDLINTIPEKPRIMNIHPALLPAFPGTDGYGDTFRYGCKVGGCTVHFVDYGEDTGPIIGQQAVSIHPGDIEDIFKERGLKAEWELYPKCIQLFAEGRLKVVDNGDRKVVEILPWKKNPE